MINHNSNLIEVQFGNAGSGSLFLEDALVYLVSSDYPGSGSWTNRVGNAITTSGSFVNSGSAGWAFNASGRLNLEESVSGVTFKQNVRTEGITFVIQAQLGSYSDAATPVLMINSLDGSIFSSPGGYNGTSYQYRQSGSIASMKNEATNAGESLPTSVSSSVSLFAMTMPSGSGNAYLYYNDASKYIATPVGGTSFGYSQNDEPVVFGNYADQDITVPSVFFTTWQRYRGTLKTLLVYNRELNDSQLRKVFNNLRRGV